MKRTEIYKKTCKIKTSPNPEDRGEEYISDNDNLTDKLRKICINQEREFDVHKIAQDYSFLFYNGEVLVGIDVEGNKFDDKYERTVCLEIMPLTAKTPKELSDLLSKTGFKKSE